VGTLGSDYPVGTDLDIFLYIDGELAAASAGATADELISGLPPGLTFDVYVVQWGLAGGRTEQDVKLHFWSLRPGAVGNLTLTPSTPTVKAGELSTITANWSGLQPGAVYLGLLQFGQRGSFTGSTFVTVRT
jgi:hypothetical protein